MAAAIAVYPRSRALVPEPGISNVNVRTVTSPVAPFMFAPLKTTDPDATFVSLTTPVNPAGNPLFDEYSRMAGFQLNWQVKLPSLLFGVTDPVMSIWMETVIWSPTDGVASETTTND